MSLPSWVEVTPQIADSLEVLQFYRHYPYFMEEKL